VNLPKPIGYEWALKKADEARKQRESGHEKQNPNSDIAMPVPTRPRSSTLRAQAPVFTPINRRNEYPQMPPGTSRINPCDRFRDNNKHLVSDTYPVTLKTEKKVPWDGIGNNPTSSTSTPQTWLEKVGVLVGKKLEPYPYRRAFEMGENIMAPRRAPQVAIPRSFEPPQKKK
jgi:hypothetical protein